MGTLNFDRYHAAMGDASYKEVTRVHGKPLSETSATFYCTQRKLPFAPVLGHERLIRLLVDSQLDRPRLRFLEQDRGGLQRFAKAIEDIQFAGRIRTVRPGTIMFPQQPFADITGKFGLTQAQEIKFEHAFDLPMTTARVAMQFRMSAGDRWLSDFGEWCLRCCAPNGLAGLTATLRGDLNVERLKKIVEEFPEAARFGIGTKLPSEVRNVARVIFKACVIDGRPTLKASNSLDK